MPQATISNRRTDRFSIKRRYRLIGYPRKAARFPVAIDPGSINPGETAAIVVTGVTGALVGARWQKVIVTPPAALEPALRPRAVVVTDTDEVTISLEHKASTPNAVLTTALVGDNNDLVYTAKLAGAAGDGITIEYEVGGISTPLSVAVVAKAITVTVETDEAEAALSTATEVAAIIAATPAAAALVTVANAPANDGSGVVTALASTGLYRGGAAVNGAEREWEIALFDVVHR